MRLAYHYVSDRNGKALSNMDRGSADCRISCDSDMENHYCPFFGENRRRGKVKIDCGKLYLCTNEAVKSNRLFKEKRKVMSDVMSRIDSLRKDIRDEVRNDIRRHIHNLISLNAKSIQDIYSTVPQEVFIKSDREELIESVQREVENRPKSISKLIIDLLKNENLEKTEFSVYSKIYEDESLDIRGYKIHKVFLLVLNSFWSDFNEKSVKFRIGNCHRRVKVDFDVLAAAFVHLIDNTAKYILPESQLRVSFRTNEGMVCVDLDMVSLKIEDAEVDSIWSEGYSGKRPRQLNREGEGIGLAIVKNLIESIDGTINLIRDQNPSLRTIKNDIKYENNVFSVCLPLDE